MPVSLSFLDIYALKTEFSFNRSQKYSSSLGIAFSFISFAVIAAFTFLFGQDIIFKTNPRMVSQVTRPEQYNMIELTNENFPIFLKFADHMTDNISKDRWMFHPRFLFWDFQRIDGRDIPVHILDVPLKKCSETSHKNLDLFENINTEFTYCLDFDYILAKTGKEKLLLGGFFDNDVTTSIRIELNACKYTPETNSWSECVSHQELERVLKTEKRYVSVNYPTFYLDLDSQDKPLKKAMNSEVTELRADIAMSNRNFLNNVNFFDDKGWILEDVTEYNSIASLRIEKDISLLKAETFVPTNSKLFSYYFYGAAEENEFKRSYKKVQELAAQAGGFVKAVTIVFSLLLKPLVNFQRNKELVKYASVYPIELTTNNFSQAYMKAKKVRETSGKPKLSWCQYLRESLFFYQKSDKYVAFNKQLSKITRQLDVVHYLQMCSKIEDLEESQIRVNNLVKD